MLDVAYQALLGMASSGETKHLGISYVSLKLMFDESMKGVEKKLDWNMVESPVVSLERVYEIFSGDPKLLSAGVSNLVRIGIQRKHRFEDTLYTQLVQEDALQIALLTKNPFLMSSSYLDILSHSKVSRVDGQNLSSVDTHFCLHEFWSVFYLIMSSYCMNYVMSAVSISDYSRKASFIAEQFLTYARSEGTEIDLIQALCVNALIQNKLSNLKVSLQYFNELRALYKYDVHSCQLIEKYGADHLIYIVTRTIKFMVLSNETEKSIELISDAMLWFNSLSHVASLTLSVLRLASVLAYVDRFEDALSLLAKYESVVAHCSAHVNECIPFSLLRLYRVWLERHSAVMLMTDLKDESLTIDLILEMERVLLSEDKHVQDSNPVVMYHKQDVLIMLADLYALKIKKDLHWKESLSFDCTACCKYLHSVMESQVIDTHDVFCQARATRVVKEALHTLSHLTDNTDYLKTFQKVFSPHVMSNLRKEAQINQLTALSRDVIEVNLILSDRK